MENKIKTTIHHLIILDESGSMSPLRARTIAGCKETLQTIHSAQKQYGDTQENLVSIYLFQHNSDVPSRYVIRDRKINEVSGLKEDMYRPWGATPLYDAIGATLCDLVETIGDDAFAIGSVTVITDGYENASDHYSLREVKQMIDALKEKGWNFNFIGANLDAVKEAASMGIDNALQWEADEEGTGAMYDTLNSSRANWAAMKNQEIHEMRAQAPCMSEAELKEEYVRRSKKSSKGFFHPDI